jgi:hypothetical protein
VRRGRGPARGPGRRTRTARRSRGRRTCRTCRHRAHRAAWARPATGRSPARRCRSPAAPRSSR